MKPEVVGDKIKFDIELLLRNGISVVNPIPVEKEIRHLTKVQKRVNLAKQLNDVVE